jgi:hypothetical protein
LSQVRGTDAKPSGDIFGLAALFRKDPSVKAGSQDSLRMSNGDAGPAWADLWHLWTIFIPRRSISGRLVWAKVWRRYDGRHWIYKKFIEYGNDD